MQGPEAECTWRIGGRGRVAGPERFARVPRAGDPKGISQLRSHGSFSDSGGNMNEDLEMKTFHVWRNKTDHGWN